MKLSKFAKSSNSQSANSSRSTHPIAKQRKYIPNKTDRKKMPDDVLTQLSKKMDKIGDETTATANGIRDIKTDMIRIFKDIGELKEDMSNFKNAMKEIAAMKEAQKEMKERIDKLDEEVKQTIEELDKEKDRRKYIEDELDRINNREKWDQAARTTMITGLDKKSNLNEKMTYGEMKDEVKKLFRTAESELQKVVAFRGAKGLITLITTKTMEGKVAIQREIRQECKSFMGKQNNYEIYISDYYLKEDMETSRFLLEYGKYRKTNKDIAAYAVRYSNDGISYYEKADGQQRYRYILPSIVKNDPEYRKAQDNVDSQKRNAKQLIERRQNRIENTKRSLEMSPSHERAPKQRNEEEVEGDSMEC